ncbi:MAG: NUDIX domain-containing protein [Halolamina sp.]
MANVRPQVLGALRRPDTGEYLVQRLSGNGAGHFHRFVGGGIHPGETSDAAIERELREELDAAVTAGAVLCTVENLFSYAGESSHELIVVRGIAFDDQGLYDRERFRGVDAGGDVQYEAYWRSLDALREADAPFYPDGIGNLLARADGPTHHLVSPASADGETAD